jgi:alanine racemase
VKYPLDHIAVAIGSSSEVPPVEVDTILLDSRKVNKPGSSLFFALGGPRRDGHQFIGELYKKGVRSFVVSKSPDASKYPGAHFLVAPDTLLALQQLAIHHRGRFGFPVIGITGSNGKTIVKEWLYQLIQEDFVIVRSPRSYNSQIGVPLSVWQMDEADTLGIFEAGISQPGEMDIIEKMIQPDIGVFTNIGEAHSEGFRNNEEKLYEKLKLFTHAQILVAREKELPAIKAWAEKLPSPPTVVSWGTAPGNELVVKSIHKAVEGANITVCPGSAEWTFSIPFSDDAAIENAITCCMVLLQLGYNAGDLSKRMERLQTVNMRLELKKGIHHCVIINDSYSADLDSLEIALNLLDQQQGVQKKTVILSDLLQSGKTDDQLYTHIITRLRAHQVTRVIGIGTHISKALQGFQNSPGQEFAIELYHSTRDYLRQFRSTQFRDEVILVKGARIFGFEEIVQLLEQKDHQTVLEINLNAIVQNVNVYQSQLNPSTKMMAMVKAFAYGSGGAEIANVLQFHKVDYLGVAYADEGADLRKAGVTLPVMVMNPETAAYESIVEHHLEPDLYSMEALNSFVAYLEKEGLHDYPIHLEIETGMNRLGFAVDEIESLARVLAQSNRVKVQSVFSHLAASEDPDQDEFTMQQFRLYEEAVLQLKNALPYTFIRHIANSAGIFRHPQLQLDMVRLGIGMYGIDSALSHQALLQPAATLTTTIAQLKHLPAGTTIGYNRRGVLAGDSVIATVRIGYADGYHRSLGHGKGKMLVNGHLAPVVGSICMDMTMLDVTGIPSLHPGDEVIVFGKGLPLQLLAQWAGTIPYEIMTGISQRVKRVYFEE